MANYDSPTVVQQTIPLKDMTDLECEILTNVFDFEDDGDGIYLYQEFAPRDEIELDEDKLKKLLEAEKDSELAQYILKQLPDAHRYGTEVVIDMSGYDWSAILQEVVRRSETLTYLSVTTAYTCTKMRRDGFGGSAVFITADEIKCMSTDDFIAACVRNMVVVLEESQRTDGTIMQTVRLPDGTETVREKPHV